MTDDELRAACDPNALERGVERTGCISTLLVGIVVGVVAARYAVSSMVAGSSMMAGFGAFFGCCWLVGVGLSRIAKRRRIPLRNELRRRLPKPFEIGDAKAALAGEEPPDWVLMQHTTFLLNGIEHTSLVRVWRSPDRAFGETRSFRFGPRGRDASEQMQARCGAKPWEPARAEELVALLEEHDQAPRVRLDRWTVIDGAAGLLHVLKREPPSHRSISANLWVGHRDPDCPAAVRLLNLIGSSLKPF